MKRALVPLIGLLALAAAILWSNGLGGDVAYADGGPHGGYQDVSGGLPSQCAACHREHQGKSVGKLLKAASQYGLCLTCHNGAGSQLDVLDGVKLGAIIDPDAAAVGFVENVPLAITMSAAPYANLNSYASGQVFFTIAVRSSGPATTLNLSVADSNLVDFNASTIEDMSGTAIATFNAAAGPAVGYFRVKSSAKSTAVDTDSNLATLTADSGGTNIVLKLQMRIGTNPNVLNGGGFINVNGLPITSRHNEDPAENALNPWGYNSNTGQNTNALINPLQCTSCHNPHGTANYRLLKQTVNSQTVNVKAWYSGAFTKDEGGAGISGGTQPADKYAKEYYGSEADGSGAPTTGGGSMASLCGACHTAYPSAGASAAYTVGGVTHFRHRTEMPFTNWTNPETGLPPLNPETSGLAGFPALRLASNGTQGNTVVTCLTCHRVHGSSATMSNYALKKSLGGLADEDLTPTQTATAANAQAAWASLNVSHSTLLFTNNRGMCEACHQW